LGIVVLDASRRHLQPNRRHCSHRSVVCKRRTRCRRIRLRFWRRSEVATGVFKRWSQLWPQILFRSARSRLSECRTCPPVASWFSFLIRATASAPPPPTRKREDFPTSTGPCLSGLPMRAHTRCAMRRVIVGRTIIYLQIPQQLRHGIRRRPRRRRRRRRPRRSQLTRTGDKTHL